jgi:hypothetical protein
MYNQQQPRGTTMILLMGGREEERTINGHSTGRLPIIQPPTITVTICLVGG